MCVCRCGCLRLGPTMALYLPITDMQGLMNRRASEKRMSSRDTRRGSRPFFFPSPATFTCCKKSHSPFLGLRHCHGAFTLGNLLGRGSIKFSAVQHVLKKKIRPKRCWNTCVLYSYIFVVHAHKSVRIRPVASLSSNWALKSI